MKFFITAWKNLHW